MSRADRSVYDRRIYDERYRRKKNRRCTDCGKLLTTANNPKRCLKCAARWRIETKPETIPPSRLKTGKRSYRRWVIIKGWLKCCVHCRSTKNLLVHHKDHNRDNNSLENLAVVCAKCHTTIEHPRKFYGNQHTKK